MKTTTTLAILSIIVFACHRKAVAASDEIIISNKTEVTKTKVTSTAQACRQDKLFTVAVAAGATI